MNPDRVFAIVLRQYYLMKGSFARFVPLFLGVAVDILLWGYLERYLYNSSAATGHIPVLLGAVVLFDFFSRIMHGVTMAFFEDVWTKNFYNFFTSPLKTIEYLGGLVITGLATSIVGLITMMIVAHFVFDLPLLCSGAFIAPFVLILIIFGIALGIVGCSIVLLLGPSSEWFIWPIPALLSPFAGAFYPIGTLPGWLQSLSLIFPLSHAFEGIRSVLTNGKFPVEKLVIGSLLSLFYLWLAILFFQRVYRYAIKNGLIAKYAAESVS
jgi:ABC-2 type transport system permease protein